MAKLINGIQQIGIGNPDVYKLWEWYRKAFKMDVPIFDEAATAGIMLPYTGGEPRERHAVLAMNMQGGAGFEIWQYTKRTPVKAEFEIKLGDIGINVAKIKSRNILKTFEDLNQKDVNILTDVNTDPSGKKSFFLSDPLDNIFQVETSGDWFQKNKDLTGGLSGAIIGVTDIDKSLSLYSDVLGYSEIVYDKTGVFEDFKGIPGGNETFRRARLEHTELKKGAFSELLGKSNIELVQVISREPKNIFANRFWGDIGFIHLCFDITGMSDLKQECKEKGFPFTVDSAESFDMGEAAGHFAYIEDPDGTLIEFVETHKIPIIKKVGWYLNLKNRKSTKPLPKLILKTLGLARVKDK